MKLGVGMVLRPNSSAPRLTARVHALHDQPRVLCTWEGSTQLANRETVERNASRRISQAGPVRPCAVAASGGAACASRMGRESWPPVLP